MSNYSQKNPILFLHGSVASITVLDSYKYDDGSGLGPSGMSRDIKFLLTVSSIAAQSVGTNVAGATQSSYNALDIKVGQWVTDNQGEICLKILSVLQQKLKVMFSIPKLSFEISSSLF